MDNVETTFVRIPYPEALFSDGRESNWYTNPESKRVYKRVKVGESFRFVEQIHNIPHFVFNMITPEHQEECRIHKRKKYKDKIPAEAWSVFGITDPYGEKNHG